jgi:hypothetical protein
LQPLRNCAQTSATASQNEDGAVALFPAASNMMYIYLLLFMSLTLLHRSRCAEKKKSATQKMMTFQQRVENAYQKVIPCLKLSPTLNYQQLSFDADLENHYKDVLKVTAQFRGLPPHNGSYYGGTTSNEAFAVVSIAE